MSRRLSSMTTEELVYLFEQFSLAHGEAVDRFDSGKANQAIERYWKVLAELRRRNGDERKALFVLYRHKNPQVRLNVAHYTFALDPSQASMALRQIADSRLFPWAGEAMVSLASLADGSSKLMLDREFPPKREPKKD